MTIEQAKHVVTDYNKRYNTQFSITLRIDLYSTDQQDWHDIGAPAVYFITSAQEEVLLIGRADALGPRLWEYFRNDDCFWNPKDTWMTKPRYAYAITCQNDAHWELYSLELYLIEMINPEENIRAGMGALGARLTPLEERIGDELTRKFSKRYEVKMHELDFDGEFARDNSFHGNMAPRHMMYKLPPLYTKDRSIKYEFLIEYEKGFPVQGIYYGCKGLILDGEQMQQNHIMDSHWKEIKEKVAEVLDDTFPDKRFLVRFKETDNINNKTYWPFWITLGEDENIIEVAGRATKLMRKVYKEKLCLVEDETLQTAPAVCQSKREYTRNALDAATSTAFTEVAMERIMNHLTGDKDKSLFLDFLKNGQSMIAEDYGKNVPFFTKSPLYANAWHINIKNVEFASLLYALFWEKSMKPRLRYNGLDDENVPWEDMESIFRDRNDKKFKNRSLSNLWSKNKNDKKKEFAKTVIEKILNHRDI